MPLSSSIHQTHTILGGSGFRYETVELVLASIPHFELKQKGRILHLFAEVRFCLSSLMQRFKMRPLSKSHLFR